MNIRKTENKALEAEILKALENNLGYCPCKLEHIPDNKCMCKDFREQLEGECHCGLYIKTP